MKKAHVNGVELEYEISGHGEPVLLISPVLADGFVPLLGRPELQGYSVIVYHKRGWVGSTPTPGPVSVAEHAQDAAALLDHLEISQAHVGGHSSGAAAAIELALDRPGRVRSLLLFEPSVLTLPAAAELMAKAGPAMEAYAAGRHAEAFAQFMTVVSGLEWNRCSSILEKEVPGMIDQSIKDADTFFAVELPSLMEWTFGPDEAARISQPTLSILGTETESLWIAVDQLLRRSVKNVETREIEGAGHLLHLQQPESVARALDAFLRRHPLPADA
jgi:3-oxoadipate enol-lactonase